MTYARLTFVAERRTSYIRQCLRAGFLLWEPALKRSQCGGIGFHVPLLPDPARPYRPCANGWWFGSRHGWFVRLVRGGNQRARGDRNRRGVWCAAVVFAGATQHA